MKFSFCKRIIAIGLLLAATACFANSGDHSSKAETAYEGMKSSLITIRSVQLEGDAYYPEYGLTREFFKTRIDQLFSHTGQILNMTEIHQIADSITLAYREKGLTFNQAYVVPQEITQGTLRIHVLAGKLAEIDVFNNALYSQQQILAPFEPLLGKVIYEPDLKAAVSELSSKPGLNIFTYFSVGSRQGETRLNIRVMHENPDYVTLAVDNYGINQTGENRLMLDYQRHNLLSLSGKLNLSVLATEESDNLFGGLNFQAPIGSGNSWGIAFLRSEYAVSGEFEALGLTGKLSNTSIFWSTIHKLSSVNPIAHNFRFQLNFKASTTESLAFAEVFENKIRYSQLMGRYQLASSSISQNKSHLKQEFAISPSIYKLHDAVNTELPEEFSILRANYHLLLSNWVDLLGSNHVLSVKSQGQWTDDKLPSAEYMASTGPTTNRGFLPGLFNGDNGVNVSIEQTFYSQLPLASASYVSIQPSVFIDASYAGNQHERVYAAFTSVGLGLALESKKSLNKKLSLDQLSAQLSAGYPVNTHYSENTEAPIKDLTLYGRIRLRF